MNYYHDIKEVVGHSDLKLEKLKNLISEKIENPLNSGNKKVIVFTAFADTANYLYESLAHYLKDKYGINTALITGSKRQSSAKNIPSDLNVLLTCFSPLSKSKAHIMPHLEESIDVLIATDCISEGQNLQDCDYLVNYDIHWNPVRIIQRFGRIDRIGSINSNITMVNFWPDVTLDKYINLKQRVENKMLISNMASTGDDNILNTDEKDLEYRKIQLMKLQEEVVDLEDLKEGVSITDLGLNDFRVDLSNYIKIFGDLRNIPQGLHAVVKAKDAGQRGVIYVLRNTNNEVNIDKHNRLHPYYLVYLNASGEIIQGHLEAKKTLDTIRLLCKGEIEPMAELCNELGRETNEYRKMQNYTELLQKGIGSIVKIDEEKEVLSLFSAGGTTALTHALKGIEDFSLVTFIVIK